jgi:hypothetical protein
VNLADQSVARSSNAGHGESVSQPRPTLFANPQKVDVLAYLVTLGALLEVGGITREEYTERLREFRGTLSGLSGFSGRGAGTDGR